MIPFAVTTMSSANSVPRTTTLSKPLPPSIDTGGADVERARGREAEADDRTGDTGGVARDDVVPPVVDAGRHVRVGRVADAVSVVVEPRAGQRPVRILGGRALVLGVRIQPVRILDVLQIEHAVPVRVGVDDRGERE